MFAHTCNAGSEGTHASRWDTGGPGPFAKGTRQACRASHGGDTGPAGQPRVGWGSQQVPLTGNQTLPIDGNKRPTRMVGGCARVGACGKPPDLLLKVKPKLF